MKQGRKVIWASILVLCLMVLMMPNMTVKAEESSNTAPNYLTFTAKEAGSTVTLSWETAENVMCRMGEGGNWVEYVENTAIALENVGDTVSFKAYNLKTSMQSHFKMTGTIDASGSVTSLTDGNGGDSKVVLTERCYEYMFSGCKSLEKAPELPATILAPKCYEYMFLGSGLIKAPKLPATNLEEWCYLMMFYQCRALKKAPELPATTLKKGCYCEMFNGCSKITTVPKLPATTLAVQCYDEMFANCISLNISYIKDENLSEEWILPIAEECENWNRGMFSGFANIIFNDSTFDSKVPSMGIVYYQPKSEDEGNYLTFTAEEAGSTVALSWLTAENVMYRMGKGNDWVEYVEDAVIVLENVGDSVSFKAYNLQTASQKHFLMSGKIAASGSVTSLTDGNGGNVGVVLTEYCYASMFSGCESLTKAPELPATTLADSCYSLMFAYCSNLVEASELPATILKAKCYGAMFSGCESLTKAPKLPATTLAEHCYEYMFAGCRNLVDAPELPATTLAEHCYEYMFNGCRHLMNAPELPATNLEKYCYASMFQGCTHLTKAPELPATTLADYCYLSMFYACKRLEKAPELPATQLARYCYQGMFMDCKALTKAPELPALKLSAGCYSSMFFGCSGLTTAPKLPATTISSYCYQGMFENCTGIDIRVNKDESHSEEWGLQVITNVEKYRDWNVGMFDGCTNVSFDESGSKEPVMGQVYYQAKLEEEEAGYTGLVCENDNWYYQVDGRKVDYTGLTFDEKVGWWYVENGAINFSYNGLVQNEYGWWCVAGGRVAFEYTGLWYDEMVGWWYVENGSINFAYNGLIPYNDSWWCVAGGRVAFEYTGLWSDPVVGWWYVENGMIVFAHSGFVPNELGWWYVDAGRVAFEKNGICYDDTVGMWYVTGGMIDFSYNGTGSYNGTSYKIVNGFATN